jgi:hypothetical protein
VILVAESGDFTQILTAGLAVRYHDPVAVGIGSVLALWSVAAMAIAVGRGLLRVIPLTWITRAAAAAADPRRSQPRRGDLVNQPAGGLVWAGLRRSRPPEPTRPAST